MAILLRGAVAGAAATWLMDAATTAVQKLQPREDAERERAAWPNGQPSVMNLVDRIVDGLGVGLDERSRASAAGVAHYALGIVPGALYAALRHPLPAVSAGRGLVFGVLLWAANDEFLNTRLGLAGPPTAYPLMTHVRGLIGHVVLGVGTELGIGILAVIARVGRRVRS
jgi:uncharacterized membrane protein YagU involved in acid resistance